ncbi:hypothetical protein BGZ80_010244 [Entomortierella chlamydospora]|uniref:Uncharacterized protein n=1 Tax=Entomortierella chlamydospora TaxID=101097 RepID=A0A9P6MW58_9FUNG|nr:hypothetical protein BGZ79_010152 [Entomortierella chlamydospora]KAG0014759.1 hypothetical protein BGZ80_010244 [Entomortierella chlamydospora]
MQVQEPSYPLAARLSGSQPNLNSNAPRIPPRPDQTSSTYAVFDSPPPTQQSQQQQQLQSEQQPQQYQPPSSTGSSESMPFNQSNTYISQKPPSTSSSTPPSPLGPSAQRTSHRKITTGTSPLASSPLASEAIRPTRIKPKPEMPTTLPPESVCECFICHAASPYSQQPPPEIPVNQRQELLRLAPTCPSIHLFCLASRIPMSLPLDPTQKSPLTRSILDYFYSTWISDDTELRAPRIQCLNFIPIHPITASSFDRYLEGQNWNKRICRPLWHAADLRCKLGMEGMYRNCAQDKCSSCFIFNDGFEDTIAKEKYVHLSPNSSRAHDHFMTSRVSNANGSYDPDNKVRCMVLTFAALGLTYDVPPSNEKIKRPPKGMDVVRRQFEIQGGRDGNSNGLDNVTGEEYGVFAADALVPLVMVLYKVI